MKKILVTALFCTLSAALFGLPAARDNLLADKPLVADAYEATTLQNESSQESEVKPLETLSDDSLSVTGWEGRYLPMESIFLTYTVDSECEISDYYYRNEGFEIVAEQFLGEGLEIVCKFNDVLPSLKMIFVMSDGSELTTTLTGVEADDYLVFQKDDEASPVLNMPETVAASQVTLTGDIFFETKDSYYSPYAFFRVEVYDEDVFADDYLGEFYTDRDGKYFFSFTNQTEWTENGGCDIYFKIMMEGRYVQVTDAVMNGRTYESDKIELADNIKEDSYRSFGLTKQTKNYSVIQIAQAAIYASMFADELLDDAIPFCRILYPSTNPLSYSWDTDFIFVEETHNPSYQVQAQESWDGIMHEYGHFITYHLGSGNDVGGGHDWKKDLIEDYDQETACQLAWSEGWAQMFSFMAQDWALQNMREVEGFPSVGDTFLKCRELDLNAEINYGVGERNELSILTFLFDLYDKNNEDYYDRFTLSFEEMFDLCFKSKVITFKEFYSVLTKRYSWSFYDLLKVCGINY